MQVMHGKQVMQDRQISNEDIVEVMEGIIDIVEEKMNLEGVNDKYTWVYDSHTQIE